MQLTFGVIPKTLADEAPEPNEPRYIGAFNWLREQGRYIEDELVPIGHHDMDQRRAALLRRVREELKRLDKMKSRAWSKCVAENLIRNYLRRDDQGPMIIKGKKR